jgi:hypothetical protein
MPRSGITKSNDSSVSSFLRNLHTAIHSGCTNLHSQQQSLRVPVLPHHHHHLLLLPLAIVTGGRWNLSALLICISFIVSQVEYFFMYLLAICTSSFENSLFNSWAHLFTWVLILWGLSFLSLGYRMSFTVFFLFLFPGKVYGVLVLVLP